MLGSTAVEDFLMLGTSFCKLGDPLKLEKFKASILVQRVKLELVVSE